MEEEKKPITIKDVTITDYSARSVAIQGNTKPVKDLLKGYNAKFNRYLKGGAGWIITRKKKDLIIRKLQEELNK